MRLAVQWSEREALKPTAPQAGAHPFLPSSHAFPAPSIPTRSAMATASTWACAPAPSGAPRRGWRCSTWRSAAAAPRRRTRAALAVRASSQEMMEIDENTGLEINPSDAAAPVARRARAGGGAPTTSVVVS